MTEYGKPLKVKVSKILSHDIVETIKSGYYSGEMNPVLGWILTENEIKNQDETKIVTAMNMHELDIEAVNRFDMQVGRGGVILRPVELEVQAVLIVDSAHIPEGLFRSIGQLKVVDECSH